MALRVDREAALGWLGIEGFRPSGRVRPAQAQQRLPVESDAPTADEPVTARDESRPELIETPVDTSADVPTPAVAGADDEPHPQVPVPAAEAEAEAATAPDEPADQVLPDGVRLAADSPHRRLAEAIAQVAGLACETGEGGDIVTVRGETWELAALADDGPAKRRLWRALVTRGRRVRG
ncbi:hypothetical protein [Guyparkeria halopsychrophila]|uniref:hypothetical protein n=1 Tax=Guyparkeria halopsychrophila TaxID=3139421 RepID=UPI0037C97137